MIPALTIGILFLVGGLLFLIARQIGKDSRDESIRQEREHEDGAML